MKILIPGHFSKFSSYHSKAIERILKISHDIMGSDDIRIVLFIIPQYSFNIEETAQMLMNIKNIDAVITSKTATIHSQTILDNQINLIFNFPDFQFQISNKIKEYTKGQKINDSPLIYNLDFPHPDFELSVHTFLHRQSPRAFSDVPVPQSIIEAALTASNRAPTAGNLQAYGITLVTTKSIIARVSDAAHEQEFIKSAPGVFIFNTEPEVSRRKYRDRGANLYALQDATIACSHLQLALDELGVSSRWVGAFRDKDMLQIIGRDDCRVVGILVFGYPAETKRFSSRRDLSYVNRL